MMVVISFFLYNKLYNKNKAILLGLTNRMVDHSKNMG